MAYIFEILLILSVFGVSFLRGMIPDTFYYLLIALIPVTFLLFWYFKYYFTLKKLESSLNKKMEYGIFAAKLNSADKDVSRGMFVINGPFAEFYQKKNGKFEKTWSVKRKDIEDIGFTLVSSNRPGFALIHKGGNTEFSCRRINKSSDELLKLLNLN